MTFGAIRHLLCSWNHERYHMRHVQWCWQDINESPLMKYSNLKPTRQVLLVSMVVNGVDFELMHDLFKGKATGIISTMHSTLFLQPCLSYNHVQPICLKVDVAYLRFDNWILVCQRHIQFNNRIPNCITPTVLQFRISCLSMTHLFVNCSTKQWIHHNNQ